MVVHTNLLVDLALSLLVALSVAGRAPSGLHGAGAGASGNVEGGAVAVADVAAAADEGGAVAVAALRTVEAEMFGLTRTRLAAPRDPAAAVAALGTAGDGVAGARVAAAAAAGGIPRHDMISSANVEGMVAVIVLEVLLLMMVVLLEWVLGRDG